MISDILHVCCATDSKKLFSVIIDVKHPSSALFHFSPVSLNITTYRTANFYSFSQLQHYFNRCNQPFYSRSNIIDGAKLEECLQFVGQLVGQLVSWLVSWLVIRSCKNVQQNCSYKKVAFFIRTFFSSFFFNFFFQMFFFQMSQMNTVAALTCFIQVCFTNF